MPSSQLGEATTAAMFTNHPYRKPIIGWQPEIENLTARMRSSLLSALLCAQQRHPVVAGDVAAEEVRALAEDTYGERRPRRAASPRRRPQEPAPVAARKVALSDERVQQPALQRMYLRLPTRRRNRARGRHSTFWPRPWARSRPAGSTSASCSTASSRFPRAPGIGDRAR